MRRGVRRSLVVVAVPAGSVQHSVARIGETPSHTNSWFTVVVVEVMTPSFILTFIGFAA